MQAFDYVIAGAGSAGCVLANRLSEDGSTKVLLIEAGGTNRSLFVRMPGAANRLFGNPKFDWGYETVPQPGLRGRKVYWPRGRGYGGTSAINGMIFIRGNQRDYDGWYQLGLHGWAYADVLPYFKRLENHASRRDGFHQAGGPLKTGPAQNFSPIDQIFIEAANQSGLPTNLDFNGVSQIGAGIYDVNVHKGRRWTTAVAYLDDIHSRSNLTVMTDTLVHRVLFDGTRATGVELSRHGRAEKVLASSEVILSLGAIGSPQVLQLSGVGPADELKQHCIDPIVDLPGVGRNLQDHLNIAVQYECTDPSLTYDRYQRPDRTAWLGLRYLLTQDGLAASPFWTVGAFKAFETELDYPDLQVFFTPMAVVDVPRTNSVVGKRATCGFEFNVNQMHPESRGTLKLRSTNPRDHPVIDPRYLTEEKDRRDMIEAVKWARELAHQRVFDRIRGPESSPGAVRKSDEEILDGVAATAYSGYHPTCTCKMGTDSDPMAVLDNELRVRGTDGLRVVDASAMPNVTTGNTNAPTIMIAEKASDMILGKSALSRGDH